MVYLIGHWCLQEEQDLLFYIEQKIRFSIVGSFHVSGHVFK